MKEDTFSKYKLVIDEWFINGFNGTKAYQKYYPKSKEKTADKRFRELTEIDRIQKYKEFIQKKIEDKAIYTLEQSLKNDMELISTYKAALDVLQNLKSEEANIKAAERTIKHIGASGYGSAQDRLAKQHGWFEKDNYQKQPQEESCINLVLDGESIILK
jgi:hypothetical protein